ncbi:MAG: ribonuclease III [Roseiflexaceae bacterium]|nr:ribonuclease III [Roseiflexaceae bacterium]
MPSLNKLIERLGIPVHNQRLFLAALTHSSFLNEHPQEGDLMSNERLEFLGDAVLNYVAGALVFERFPDRGEGDLSELRATLVRTSSLAAFARNFDLGAYIRLNKGEEAGGARKREALLADTFEALIAAVYLDSGMETVRVLALPLFEQRLESVNPNALRLDYRSMLQERIQAERGITPLYITIAERGPDHKREYTIEVLCGQERLGIGEGHSKQAAAQAAAQAALMYLDKA